MIGFVVGNIIRPHRVILCQRFAYLPSVLVNINTCYCAAEQASTLTSSTYIQVRPVLAVLSLRTSK